MVPDLGTYYSHPNKLLKVHINGVKEKIRRRTNSKIAEYAAIFHDIGKLNPNFQNKLKGVGKGYSNHSYLSAYAFLCWYLTNRQEVNHLFGVEGNDITQIKIITAIILHHHGNLPNMDQNQSVIAFEEMRKYIGEQKDDLVYSRYMNQEMGLVHLPFSLNEQGWFKNSIPNIDLGKNSRAHEIEHWQRRSLDNFLVTQFSFAALIESDKRDAGDNERFNFADWVSHHIMKFSKALKDKFSELSSIGNLSELNGVRTEIRKESVNTISKSIETDNRVFSLTAPTGAGKTFMLLDIAAEIQRQKGNLGIIYALPFLSITDQVEKILTKELEIDVLTVNSKSINDKIEQAQANLDYEQSDKNIKVLLEEDFISSTFDHPFIITTFVQFFETLLSNRNSTLLKLPNFANRIFLIDEIQSLPPRLYIFFAAWLDAFCKRNNSYAILSTATMPSLQFPEKPTLEGIQQYKIKDPKLLFSNFKQPTELIDAEKYFRKDVFNRYTVLFEKDEWTISHLTNRMHQEKDSVLIILNTIQDTKDLFNEFQDLDNVYLLNTHFFPNHRLAIIEEVKALLKNNQKVILISTQLIEAGVDIDFPIVYRDLCPLPSLIQSAGRCNRNKNIELGKVFMFRLRNNQGKYSSELIYRKDAKLFLNFVLNHLPEEIGERELFFVQRQFFHQIAETLEIGKYPEEKMNLIQEINNAQFENVGKFQMINNKEFGNVFRLYVTAGEDDNNFEKLEEIVNSVSKKTFIDSQLFKIKLNAQLKNMSGRIVSIRAKSINDLPPLASPKEVCGLRKLNCDNYNLKTGIRLNGDCCII